MFLLLRKLYKVSLILQNSKLDLAVTCTVEIIAKQEIIQIKKLNTKIHYKTLVLIEGKKIKTR